MCLARSWPRSWTSIEQLQHIFKRYAQEDETLFHSDPAVCCMFVVAAVLRVQEELQHPGEKQN